MNFKEIREKIIAYLKEIQSEAKKVIWPGRQYITAATIIVLVIVVLVASFIMVVDYGFAKFFSSFARTGMQDVGEKMSEEESPEQRRSIPARAPSRLRRIADAKAC